MENYQAVFTKIKSVSPIEGADRIMKAEILTGVQLVVGKDVKQGDEVVYFEANTQVNKELLSDLNLFANSSLNKDQTVKGYVSDNGKVKTLHLKGVKSEGMIIRFEDFRKWMKVKTGYTVDFTEDVSENTILGVLIAKRYEVEKKNSVKKEGQKKKKGKQVFKDYSLEYDNFDEHIKTTNFKYAKNLINEGDTVIVTPKIHGTSFRSGYVNTVRTDYTYVISWWKALINIFLPEKWKFWKEEVATKKNIGRTLVTGTRRTIVKENSEGFHGSNQYRIDVTNKLQELLKKISGDEHDIVFYGEIYGFVNGTSIMPPHDTSRMPKEYKKKYHEKMVYKYGCQPDEYKFKIYRVTVDGKDLAYDVFKHVIPEEYLFEPIKRITVTEDWDAFVKEIEYLTERPDVQTEDYYDPEHISEGVILRVENGDRPILVKSKSFFFLNAELEQEEETVEEEKGEENEFEGT